MLQIRRVNLKKQFEKYRAELLVAIERVLDSGSYTLGDEVVNFEREFAAYLHIAECVTVADGTRAIAILLNTFGVKAGDEVITTAFTAIPTIGAIMETGAMPILVDINPETWLIDLAAVEKKLTNKTKAIVPVHMFGNVVDIPRLRGLIGKRIRIIEDAAQAHGSQFCGSFAGTMGDAGTFSFYPTKNLGAYGDGGAIVTQDMELAERLRIVRNHGMKDKDTYICPGVNSRLDEIQAATLRVKLRYLDQMNTRRALFVREYLFFLDPDRFKPQYIPPGVQANNHIFQVRYLGDRDGLIRHLDQLGIQSNVYYRIPHHLQPGLKGLGYKVGSLPILENLCRESVALPLYPEMEMNEVRLIAGECNEYAFNDPLSVP